MTFDPRTKALIEEFFSDKVCCKCGERAERMLAKQFYCAEHLPGQYSRKVPVEIHEATDPKPKSARSASRGRF